MASLSSLLAILLLLMSSFSSSVTTLSTLEYLLYVYGLPSGIFPENVKDFTLNRDNVLEVQLEEPCLTEFETMVYFHSVVTANLSHGKLLDIQGLSNKELFIWLPVKGIIANYPFPGVVTVDISLANKTMSITVFDKPLTCFNLEENAGQVPLVKNDGNKEVGMWVVRRLVISFIVNFL